MKKGVNVIYIMERVLHEIPAGQWLVVREDDTVIFSVAFMTPFHSPFVRFLLLRSETSNVISKHVKVGTVMNDPACQLFCTTCTQHLV